MLSRQNACIPLFTIIIVISKNNPKGYMSQSEGINQAFTETASYPGSY